MIKNFLKPYLNALDSTLSPGSIVEQDSNRLIDAKVMNLANKLMSLLVNSWASKIKKRKQ